MAGDGDGPSEREASRRLTLDLSEGGVHGLTPSVWGAFAEAAAVMLEHYHPPPPPPHPCTVHAADGVDHPAAIVWIPASDATRASHANKLNATEWGAYALAAMAVHALRGWRVVARTHHGSGADFLMMASDDPEAFMRLEVSGIADCAESTWRTLVFGRLGAKVDQLARGNLDYPGAATVVSFQVVHIAVSDPQQP